MPDETNNHVPQWRFNDVVSEKNEWKTKAEDALKRIKALEADAASATQLAKRVEELEAAQIKLETDHAKALKAAEQGKAEALETLRAEAAIDLNFASSGIPALADPEVRGIVRSKFDAQREGGVGDPGEWLKRLRENPDGADTVLKALLNFSATNDSAGATQTSQTAANLGKAANAGGAPPPPPSSPVTVEQIRAAKGNPAEVARLLSQARAQDPNNRELAAFEQMFAKMGSTENANA